MPHRRTSAPVFGTLIIAVHAVGRGIMAVALLAVKNPLHHRKLGFVFRGLGYDSDTSEGVVMTAGRSDLRTTGTLHERFGGVDTPSALAGMFTSLGVLVFLSSLVAAWGADFGYSVNMLDADGVLRDYEVVTSLVLLVVVFGAFFVGGWAAGRMARIDGGITGVASAMWMLLLIVTFAAIGAFIGAEANAFGQAGLPDWVSQLDSEDMAVAAGIATIVTILVMFLASWLGGKAGETYSTRDPVYTESMQPTPAVRSAGADRRLG